MAINDAVKQMEQELITRTNKAEFFRLADGSLLKKYLPNQNPVEKLLQDHRSLRFLEDKLGELVHEGWVYRTVRLLDIKVDQRTMRLEFVPGDVLSNVCKSKMKEAEFRCGIWLALYHNKVLGGLPQGLIYWDFNVHNVIVDFERRTVVAIDPGMSWGRTGYAYQDLVRHMHSALVTLVVKRKSSFTALVSFLKGYAVATQTAPHLWSYYKGLRREIRRQFYQYSRKSYAKLVAYPFVLAMTFPFYFGFVPGYLWLKAIQRS